MWKGELRLHTLIVLLRAREQLVALWLHTCLLPRLRTLLLPLRLRLLGYILLFLLCSMMLLVSSRKRSDLTFAILMFY